MKKRMKMIAAMLLSASMLTGNVAGRAFAEEDEILFEEEYSIEEETLEAEEDAFEAEPAEGADSLEEEEEDDLIDGIITDEEMEETELSASVKNAASSGTCGDELTWTLDDEGTLTISGSGEMTSSPWEKAAIRKVIIQEGVTSIRYLAFNNCENLTSIVIPDSVTDIGAIAFENCKSLTSITIPKGVTELRGRTFNGCKSLSSVTLPEGLTSIGAYDFWACSNLTSIDIPETVTSLGRNAFAGCASLTDILIPEGVTSIESSTFSGCANLTSIRIPDKVTSIGDFAFSDCTNLTGISIPDGVAGIGRSAFKGCTSLTSISIPDGVTSIDQSAFENCTSLSEITLPKGLTSIGEDAFQECTSLTSITLPEGLTSIGERAFRYCTSLTDIYIPAGVSVSKDIFYNLRIENIFYGGTEEEWEQLKITKDANIYYGCRSMRKIIFDSSTISASKGDTFAVTATVVDGKDVQSALPLSWDLPEGVSIVYTSANASTDKSASVITIFRIGQNAVNGDHTITGAAKDGSAAESAALQIRDTSMDESSGKKLAIVQGQDPKNTAEKLFSSFGDHAIEIIPADASTNGYDDALYWLNVEGEITLTDIPAETAVKIIGSSDSVEVYSDKQSDAVFHISDDGKPSVDLTLQESGNYRVITSKQTMNGQEEKAVAEGSAEAGKTVTVNHQQKPAADPETENQKDNQKDNKPSTGNGDKNTNTTKPVSNPKLNAASFPLKTRQKFAGLKVTGIAAGDRIASWRSSNPKAVKVSSTGALTAQKKTGKATITVTLASGKTASCEVKVQKKKVTTKKISGLSKTLTLTKGQSITLSPTITPISSTDKITYTTSNKKVVTVSKKGVIKAKKAGKAKITVKSGKKKYVIKVKVS